MKITKRSAAMLGIAAGYALLLGVFAATKSIDRSDVAILAACFGGSMAAMVPLMTEKRAARCVCRANAQPPR